MVVEYGSRLRGTGFAGDQVPAQHYPSVIDNKQYPVVKNKKSVFDHHDLFLIINYNTNNGNN